MELLILLPYLLILTVCVFALQATLSLHSTPALDWIDIDYQSCEQMRDSGWTEKEIEDFMDAHNGYYDR
jgi:hypothetical protein